MVAFAQPASRPLDPLKTEKREEIESYRIAFLTQKLSLTPEEAQRFWPVFNQFTAEMKTVKANRVSKRDMKNDIQNQSDKDVEKMVDGEIAIRQQELDVVKKYHTQFKQILPIKKVAILYRAEDEFKKELLEKIRERKGKN
jgi:hypothetical protein